MRNGSGFVPVAVAALFVAVGAFAGGNGKGGGGNPPPDGGVVPFACIGIGQPCTMADQCTGTWVCNGGIRECAYNNPGSRPCTTCPSGRQACSDTGPFGPCQSTPPPSCTNTCGTGTQTCSDGVFGQCSATSTTSCTNGCGTG